MGRVKLELPEKFNYSCEVSVRVTDLNYGNHLGNQHILGFAQEARIGWLKSHGFTELNFGGVALIQADAAIMYKCEGHLGDLIKIEVAATQVGRSAFDVFYKMTNMTKDKVLAKAKTAIVCYDYEAKKPVPIPEEVLNCDLFTKD